MAKKEHIQSTSEEQKPEDRNKSGTLKTIAVTLLVVLAIVVGYYLLIQSAPSIKYDEGTEVNGTTYAAGLQKADKVTIVMDVREITSEKQRGNIMQCGTDFAGSDGLVGKELVVYALEDNKCTSLNSTSLSVNDCITDALSNFAIFIKDGSKTAFMEKKMIVGIGEEYTFGSCKVNIKSSQ
jgi:hypothetical protein